VCAYLNNEKTTVLPLAEAESGQQRAASVLQQVKDLENAIETELAHSRSRLNDRHRKLDDALGLVVSRSPELLALRQQVKDAWQRLRTLRTAFAAISKATGGRLDGGKLLDGALAGELIDAGFRLSQDEP
jgi:hypothetical protein